MRVLKGTPAPQRHLSCLGPVLSHRERIGPGLGKASGFSLPVGGGGVPGLLRPPVGLLRSWPDVLLLTDTSELIHPIVTHVN